MTDSPNNLTTMQFKWQRIIWYCSLLLINILGLLQPTLSALSQVQPPVRCISCHSTGHEVLYKAPRFFTANGEAVQNRTFSEKLRTALNFIGLPTTRYTPYSFRIGGTSEMALQGASELQIKQAGRWASNAHLSYIRLNWWKNDIMTLSNIDICEHAMIYVSMQNCCWVATLWI